MADPANAVHSQSRSNLGSAAAPWSATRFPLRPASRTSRRPRGRNTRRTRVSRRRRRIKIIATLGPASADRATLARLFDAGADVFRINMSHATHDGMRERIAMIRDLEEEVGRPIGVLVDLQGPKLRVGEFVAGAESLRRGDSFTLDCD